MNDVGEHENSASALIMNTIACNLRFDSDAEELKRTLCAGDGDDHKVSPLKRSSKLVREENSVANVVTPDKPQQDAVSGVLLSIEAELTHATRHARLVLELCLEKSSDYCHINRIFCDEPIPDNFMNLDLIPYKQLPSAVVIPAWLRWLIHSHVPLTTSIVPTFHAITPLHAALTKRASREVVVRLCYPFYPRITESIADLVTDTPSTKRKGNISTENRSNKRVHFNITASMHYKRWKAGRSTEFSLERALQESNDSARISNCTFEFLENSLCSAVIQSRDRPCSDNETFSLKGRPSRKMDKHANIPSILKKRCASSPALMTTVKRVHFKDDVCTESKFRSGIYRTPRQRCSVKLEMNTPTIPLVDKLGNALTTYSTAFKPWWSKEVYKRPESSIIEASSIAELDKEAMLYTDSDSDSGSSSVELNISNSPPQHEDSNIPPYDSSMCGLTEQCENSYCTVGSNTEAMVTNDKTISNSPQLLNEANVSEADDAVCVVVADKDWEMELFQDELIYIN